MSQTPEVTSGRSAASSPKSPADMVLNNKVEMSVLNLKMEGYVAHVQKLGEENAALKDRLQKLMNLPDPNERRRLEAKIALLRQKIENIQVEKGTEELLLEKRTQELAQVQQKYEGVNSGLDIAQAQARDLKVQIDQLKKEVDHLHTLQKDALMKLETEATMKHKAVAEYIQNQHGVLARKVAEQREEWQKESKKEKDVLVRDYKNQVNRLEADLGDVEKEHTALKIDYATLDDGIKSTNQKNQNLREEIRNLQENLDKEKADKDREMGRLKKFIEIKQGDIERLKADLQNKNQVIIEANDNNVSLRSEILAYKRLIEQEEARLNLHQRQQQPPAAQEMRVKSPPQLAQINTKVGQASRRMATPVNSTPYSDSPTSGPSNLNANRKRPLEDDEQTPLQPEPKVAKEEEEIAEEPPALQVAFTEKKAGDATIAEVRLKEETVEIRNTSDPAKPLDLTSWFIQIGNNNLVGTKYFHPLRYKIPNQSSLEAGDSFDLKITGDEFTTSAEDLVTPGFFVQLFDGADQLVAEVVLEEQVPQDSNACLLM